jgi:hypothetical protein
MLGRMRAGPDEATAHITLLLADYAITRADKSICVQRRVTSKHFHSGIVRARSNCAMLARPTNEALNT